MNMKTKYLVHHISEINYEYINEFDTLEEAEKFANDSNDSRYKSIWIELGIMATIKTVRDCKQ